MREPEWLNGPAFVAWLEEKEGCVPEWRVGSTLTRRMTYWRQGGAASVWAVDRLLTLLGLHLSMLPEHLWIAPPAGRKNRDEARELAIRLRKEGHAVSEVASKLKVPEGTVRFWTSDAKHKAAR